MPEPEKYERDVHDRFYTDPELARAFAGEAIKMFGSKRIEYFIEPSVGDGSLVRALGAAASADGAQIVNCVVNDIVRDPEMRFDGFECESMLIAGGDWLEVSKDYAGKADLIISNPPFAKTVPAKKKGRTKRVAIIQEHAQAMMRSLSDGGLLGVLSRQSFLGKPRDIWLASEARPFKIQQLSPRPSFTGDGDTDGAEYILSWWEMFDGSCHSPKTEFEWLRWK